MSGVEILDNIDAAIHDWQVSPDAMRMRPEGFAAEAQPGLPFDIEALAVTSVALGRFMQQMARAISDAAVKFGRWQRQYGEPLVIAHLFAEAERTTGAKRHGAVKHARDRRRAYLKKRARLT